MPPLISDRICLCLPLHYCTAKAASAAELGLKEELGVELGIREELRLGSWLGAEMEGGLAGGGAGLGAELVWGQRWPGDGAGLGAKWSWGKSCMLPLLPPRNVPPHHPRGARSTVWGPLLLKYIPPIQAQPPQCASFSKTHTGKQAISN